MLLSYIPKMPTTVPQNLPSLVRNKFALARESGDLTLYETRVTVQKPFQIRFSPSLANKPKAKKDPESKPFNPFEHPTKLLVTEWPPSHNIVLNKFPINANHFILSTKDFKKQTDLLETSDLEAAYACIQAYKEEGEELFAFFNSGELSGASQPHRHIQFLPLESMQEGINEDEQWNLLADNLTEESTSNLPFGYYTSAVPSSPSPEQLHALYCSLYTQALQRVILKKGDVAQTTSSNESAISYNLALTDGVMILCPRRAEGAPIIDASGAETGYVALNGTLLGGTLLVKNESEWDALQHDPAILNFVLSSIGY